eukprot:3840985-Amphidinium_carterae.1
MPVVVGCLASVGIRRSGRVLPFRLGMTWTTAEIANALLLYGKVDAESGSEHTTMRKGIGAVKTVEEHNMHSKV